MTSALSDKTVLVTAAAQGIGRASALAFARAGARVHAVDINGVRVKALEADHPSITTHKLDVLDDRAVAALVSQIGSVDVLFNCAGIMYHDMILDFDMDHLDFAFDLNVKSMIRMIRAVLPGMIARKSGSIINMASAAGYVKGLPGQFTFSTTKAAVIGLTKSVAAECVSHGIRCNAICPGVIDTPSMNDRLKATGDYEGTRTTLLSRLPMGRFGTPEEVASLVVFVAGAPYLTGQTFMIDGGWTA
ncbi:SDR family oxidoreductase [bacterium SGD-2]|jgi:Dehydrogenases with different specificities (related to short-chain alcohol dehydrogenases)|nr:SDR family oxidoreductase [bacterium SGD-2]